MTPLIGIVIALLAGWLAPTPRTVVIAVLVPLSGATLVQTWDLGADWGSNPPDTIRQISYWIVQAVIFAVMTGLALGIRWLRVRRAVASGRKVAHPAFSGRRGGVVLLMSSIVMTAMLFATAYGFSRVMRNHGQGAGNIPWTGVLGIAVGGIVLVGLLVAIIRTAVVDHRNSAPA
ncbi:MAG: hypothetical protein ABI468_07250 [Candidatus Nanopelagicales bacterium]